MRPKDEGYSFDYNLYDECYDFDLKPRLLRTWHMDGTPCGGIRVLREWVNTTAA